MTREEAIRILLAVELDDRNVTDETIKAISIAIKSLKQEPCEDCVSRQAVLEHICKNQCSYYVEDCKGKKYNRCIDIGWVNELPSVTPSEWEQDHKLLKDCGDAVDIVLDKIIVEIEQRYCKVINDYDKGRNYGLYIATQIIKKYRGE